MLRSGISAALARQRYHIMPIEPLSYASPPVESARARHNRIYTALLIALTLFCAMGMTSLFFLSRVATMSPESRWPIDMVIGIYALLVAAMITTLILRGVAPRAGRVATMSLNIVLLFLFPFGTALAIYGLLKVDKGEALAGT